MISMEMVLMIAYCVVPLIVVWILQKRNDGNGDQG